MKSRLYVITAPSPNSNLFWRDESRGYTDSISQAGLFTEDKAKSIEAMKRGDKAIHIREYEHQLKEIYMGCRRKLEALKRFQAKSLSEQKLVR